MCILTTSEPILSSNSGSTTHIPIHPFALPVRRTPGCLRSRRGYRLPVLAREDHRLVSTVAAVKLYGVVADGVRQRRRDLDALRRRRRRPRGLDEQVIVVIAAVTAVIVAVDVVVILGAGGSSGGGGAQEWIRAGAREAEGARDEAGEEFGGDGRRVVDDCVERAALDHRRRRPDARHRRREQRPLPRLLQRPRVYGRRQRAVRPVQVRGGAGAFARDKLCWGDIC
ncbi:hypothetical protein VTG60DRAFT_2438 [Thermothelomyces hinnuleus]